MKTILIIEDNEAVRENTAEILALAQYNVLAAADGKQGVELAIQNKPDLIICDIMMPILDGHGVLHMLSRNEGTSGIPFIFLTAKAERSDLRKGMEMGADDYITKPFDDVELLNAIESRLRRTEAIQREFKRSIEGLDDFMSEVRNEHALESLSHDRDIKSYKKNDSIYDAGEYPKGIYFVSKGKIKTFHTNEHGKELITGLYKEGEFFGYLSLLSEDKFGDSATALENSEVCLIPKNDFYALIYKNADVSKRFIRILSDNLRANEEQMIKLAYNSVRKRVAEALVKLAEKYHSGPDKEFSMKISREDLATLVGTATETLIRTLSDFKDEGYIHVAGATITILDKEKLARLKN